MIQPLGHYRRATGILKQRASGTVLLLDRESGQYYTLEETGARIWDLLDGTQSVSAIVALLAEEYEAPAATIEADVLELLEELHDEKLVEAA